MDFGACECFYRYAELPGSLYDSGFGSVSDYQSHTGVAPVVVEMAYDVFGIGAIA